MMKKSIFLILISTIKILTVSAEITETDLLLSNSLTAALIPEQNYSNYPSVLAELDASVIIPYLSLSGEFENTTDKRTDDSIGNNGGTLERTLLTLVPEIDCTSFFLLDSNNVIGFDFNLNSYHWLSSSRDSYYSAASADTLNDYFKNRLYGYSDLFFSTPLSDAANLGVKIGYGFGWNPVSLETEVDYSASDPATYYNEYTEGDAVDEYIHSYGSSISCSMMLSETALNLGLIYSGYYDNRNTPYITVDSDGDGHNESFQKQSDYYSGISGTISYDYRDYSVYNNIGFSVSATIPTDSNVSFIVSGNYSILDYLYNYYAEHLFNAETTSDFSFVESGYDAGLGSFDVMTAIDIASEDKKSSFRVGVKYGRYEQNYSQNDMNASGTSSTYNNLNTANLTEINLGGSPADNSLSGNDAIVPVETVKNSLSLLARYRFNPVNKVSVFTDFNITAINWIYTFQAFNTGTNSVWEEILEEDKLNWNIGSDCGIMVPVGEDWQYTFSINSNLTDGTLARTDETLPYILNSGNPTSSGEDLNSNIDMDFSFTMKMVYSLND